MLEEDFVGDDGYESQSFFGWDYLEQAWYRVHVDSEGNRIVLRGGLQGDAMVLSGTRARSGGKTVSVRVTIRPLAGGAVEHRWQTSSQPGTWQADRSVIFVEE
jgi:hypothetical protein